MARPLAPPPLNGLPISGGTLFFTFFLRLPLSTILNIHIFIWELIDDLVEHYQNY